MNVIAYRFKLKHVSLNWVLTTEKFSTLSYRYLAFRGGSSQIHKADVLTVRWLPAQGPAGLPTTIGPRGGTQADRARGARPPRSERLTTRSRPGKERRGRTHRGQKSGGSLSGRGSGNPKVRTGRIAARRLVFRQEGSPALLPHHD